MTWKKFVTAGQGVTLEGTWTMMEIDQGQPLLAKIQLCGHCCCYWDRLRPHFTDPALVNPPLLNPASLTWTCADLVVIQLDVVPGGDGRVLALLSAFAALLLLHLPLLWGHKGTGSHPEVDSSRLELQAYHHSHQLFCITAWCNLR